MGARSFLKGSRSGGFGGEGRFGVRGAGGSGERGSCGWNVLQIIKLKEKINYSELKNKNKYVL